MSRFSTVFESIVGGEEVVLASGDSEDVSWGAVEALAGKVKASAKSKLESMAAAL